MRLKLTERDMVTFFATTEHCGQKILVTEKALKDNNEILCPGCEEPIMFRGSNGLWYETGNRIFE